HVTVMPEPMSWIDAHEDLAIAKHLRPGSNDIRVVDGHPHALLERPGKLVPRGKVRREQNSLPIQLRERLHGALGFAARHALYVYAFRMHGAQHVRMWVGLHCVVNAGNRSEPAKRAADRIHIVDIGSPALSQSSDEL